MGWFLNKCWPIRYRIYTIHLILSQLIAPSRQECSHDTLTQVIPNSQFRQSLSLLSYSNVRQGIADRIDNPHELRMGILEPFHRGRKPLQR